MTRPLAAILLKSSVATVALSVMLGLAPVAIGQEAGLPYTDENCGYTTVYEQAPRRAVTLSNNATELMLALGLEDHIAGTSYMANLKISPQFEAAYKAIPILSPLVATTEQLIDVEADFVYAGYPDGFSESRHTRDQLHDLGMQTRLNTEGCNLGRFGFAELYAEIRSVAAIFGVQERGEALVADLAGRLAAVEDTLLGVEPISVFIYNGGEAAPNAVLGHTLLSHVIDAAGGANIFGDVANRYGQVSWEQIAAEEPHYIVVFYSGTESGQVVEDPATRLGQGRIDMLNENPIIGNVPAILGQKFVMIDSVQGQPGPSSVEAVERLARVFHPDAFAQ
jgi:iron complex transport system substrate-binding protein